MAQTLLCGVVTPCYCGVENKVPQLQINNAKAILDLGTSFQSITLRLLYIQYMYAKGTTATMACAGKKDNVTIEVFCIEHILYYIFYIHQIVYSKMTSNYYAVTMQYSAKKQNFAW